MEDHKILKEMRGRKLLEALEPIPFDGGYQHRRWRDYFFMGFNTRSNPMVPETWKKGKKNRDWWQRFAMCFILLLAKDERSSIDKSNMGVDICAKVVRAVNLEDYYRERYGVHIYESAEEYASFEFAVKWEFIKYHFGSSKQRVALVFLDFMFQTDKRFSHEIVSLRKDGILEDMRVLEGAYCN